MNSKQLFHALFSNSTTQPFFDGVYPSDQLEEIILKPQMVIANTEPSKSSGKHWVLFFFEGNTMDFFDSFGQDLETYGSHFTNFQKRYSNDFWQLDEPVQSVNTNICGQLCLYFGYKRCLGFKFEEIVQSIKNTSTKDLLAFVNERYTICKKCTHLQTSVKF